MNREPFPRLTANISPCIIFQPANITDNTNVSALQLTAKVPDLLYLSSFSPSVFSPLPLRSWRLLSPFTLPACSLALLLSLLPAWLPHLDLITQSTYAAYSFGSTFQIVSVLIGNSVTASSCLPSSCHVQLCTVQGPPPPLPHLLCTFPLCFLINC